MQSVNLATKRALKALLPLLSYYIDHKSEHVASVVEYKCGLSLHFEPMEGFEFEYLLFL